MRPTLNIIKIGLCYAIVCPAAFIFGEKSVEFAFSIHKFHGRTDKTKWLLFVQMASGLSIVLVRKELYFGISAGYCF